MMRGPMNVKLTADNENHVNSISSLQSRSGNIVTDDIKHSNR